jgi:hypothetical protein
VNYYKFLPISGSSVYATGTTDLASWRAIPSYSVLELCNKIGGIFTQIQYNNISRIYSFKFSADFDVLSGSNFYQGKGDGNPFNAAIVYITLDNSVFYSEN